jgi:predicted DNA-binding protein|tara:strand:- start:2166 stop:2369 length:204 start_codon:yes stop_codon:yes gene_type:complete
MVEISEKERNRRRVKRDADTTIPAQSFRFGADVREKLLKVSRRRDRSQADVMRDLIDKEFDRLFSSN